MGTPSDAEFLSGQAGEQARLTATVLVRLDELSASVERLNGRLRATQTNLENAETEIEALKRRFIAVQEGLLTAANA
jgi:predicted  nucleic acid-binding Zn-ribbon protein